MGKFYSKLYTSSIYRKSLSDTTSITPQDIDTTLPDYSNISDSDKKGISEKITNLNTSITNVLLDNHDIPLNYLKTLETELGLKKKATKKSGKKTTLSALWNDISTPIQNSIKFHLLKRHAPKILDQFASQIGYLVRRYARHLPMHVADSEKDDLQTIAQLEFIETVKVWNVDKSDKVWPLAYSRINGAMKDHIRYVTKSDPSRFYDWVTDAGHLYMAQKTETEFEHKIENGVQLNLALEALTPKERHIVIQHARKDLTFGTIAAELGISESQISRIYKKSIEKMKKKLLKK